jgi:hypothetical protein
MEFIIHHVSNIITTDNYAPSKNFEPIEKWYEAHNYFEVTYMNCFHHVYRLLLCFDIANESSYDCIVYIAMYKKDKKISDLSSFKYSSLNKKFKDAFANHLRNQPNFIRSMINNYNIHLLSDEQIFIYKRMYEFFIKKHLNTFYNIIKRDFILAKGV